MESGGTKDQDSDEDEEMEKIKQMSEKNQSLEMKLIQEEEAQLKQILEMSKVENEEKQEMYKKND